MQLLLSKDDSSLGLHPSVYFYSWTGKQQPILFLVAASLIIDLDRKRKLPMFIKCRERFEAFLMGNRSLINQIIRKFGTKTSGTTHLKTFYEKVLDVFNSGGLVNEALDILVSDKVYSYLQPTESPYESTTAKRLSTQVKSGHTMRELLTVALRCPICQGLIPSQAISTDHVIRVEDGGSHSVDNLQSTHPYCNTGYKEAEHAKEIKSLSAT